MHVKKPHVIISLCCATHGTFDRGTTCSDTGGARGAAGECCALIVLLMQVHRVKSHMVPVAQVRPVVQLTAPLMQVQLAMPYMAHVA